MKSPVRFMARGLAEAAGDGKAHDIGRECDGNGGGGGKGARRLAPGAGGAARDHPVDEARDDARARHDFEMTAHDAVELQRLRDRTE